jgi:hypothetical protein
MGEEIQLTYSAVGRGLSPHPVVNFPEELKFPVQDRPAQDIHFSPSFSPIFQPQLPPLNPTIEVKVEPASYTFTVPEPAINITVPVPNITIERPAPLNIWPIALILFANTAIFASLVFAITFFYDGSECSLPTTFNWYP